MKKLAILGTLGLVMYGCASAPGTPIGQGRPAPARADEDNLTRELAEFRKTQVSAVAYDLSFTLDAGSSTYGGRAAISLTLNRTDQPLSLDFVGKPVQAVVVNGSRVADFRQTRGALEIPARYLRPESLIVVEYKNEFNTSPTGFYRMVDPVDQREYLYTDFEPYQAHNLFPCLDQPDLKASFLVHVNAPRTWKVISNASGVVAPIASDRAMNEFTFLRPISTYLFFLGAGDYHIWRDRYGKLPLELYSRESVARYVDAGNIFKLVKKGLAFYAQYFDRPYPFPKYGQIFIPDFLWGGMENPGAITLNERNVFRGKTTRGQQRDRQSLVLHEMAHMWFGDLVTMKWWNDTWLNESFASYMAALAQSEALKDSETWNSFFSGKAWGLWQDSLVTTHPIEAPIPDTLNARENFDGITYLKGASALQQLRYFAGPEAFRKGVQAYFRKFGGSNTSRADFVSSIAEASGKNLDAWTHAWLQTAGPNRVSADWKCTDGRVSAFTLVQSPNTAGQLSPHRTRIGLYANAGDGMLRRQAVTTVSYEAAATPVGELVGKPCPAFVSPNEGDEDYALFPLDPVSLKTAKGALSSLPDPLERLMAWETLNQMLRDGALSPSEYLRTTVSAFKSEHNESVLNVLLGRHGVFHDNYFLFPTAEQRAQVAPEFERDLWARVAKAQPGSSLQLLFLDFVVSIARTPESQARFAELLDGTSPLAGLHLDQDRRWAILTTLSAAGKTDTQQRIEREAQVDPSTRGKNAAYAAHIAYPDAALKAQAWTDLLTPGKLDESTFRSAMSWFQDPNRPELEQPFADRFFKTMASVDWSNQVHRDRVRSYFGNLFPNLCDADVLNQSRGALAANGQVNDAVRKAWLQANDLLSRCVRSRQIH
jgi:aminopeptidase N